MSLKSQKVEIIITFVSDLNSFLNKKQEQEFICYSSEMFSDLSVEDSYSMIPGIKKT